MRNVGFVKVEQGEDECMVHIHGKGLRMGSDKSLQIYLLFEDDGKCFGIWQGEADNVNPAVNECISYTEEEAGTPEIYEKIGGVALENGDGRRFAALWDEKPMDVSGMRIWRPRERAEEPETGMGSGAEEGLEAEDEAEAAERPELRTELMDDRLGSGTDVPDAGLKPEPDVPGARAKSETEVPDAGEKKPGMTASDVRKSSGMAAPATGESPGMAAPDVRESPETDTSDAGSRTETAQTDTAPGSSEQSAKARESENQEDPQRSQEAEALNGTEEPGRPGALKDQTEPKPSREPDNIMDAVPVIRSEGIFFTDAPEKPRPQKGWRTKKIQRTELAKLARCEWRLANNNFLLHGYYNYHHLILLERDEQYMLGVPGIYHEKEAAAAGAFGFPEFIAKDRLDVRLSPEECNGDHPFGYWCRPVKRAFKWE